MLNHHKYLRKVRSPVLTFNAAYGGGFNFGCMAEFWGNPKSGKSTTSYQTAELFLEDYGEDAIVLILDAEKASDDLRLRRVFNIHIGKRVDTEGNEKIIEGGDPRVILAPAITVEMAFEYLSRLMHKMKKELKGKYLFVIWDSITASGTQAEWDALQTSLDKNKEMQQYAGGMMAKPRILGQYLNKILGMLWDVENVFIILINQARTYIGRFSSGETSTGGYAKDHNIHYSLYFSWETALTPTDYFKAGSKCSLEIQKSRFGPSLKGIDLFIYDTLGGKLSSSEEIILMAGKLDLINHGGWYSLKIQGTKSYRWGDAVESVELIDGAYTEMIKFFRGKFKLVDWEWQEIDEKLAKLALPIISGSPQNVAS